MDIIRWSVMQKSSANLTCLGNFWKAVKIHLLFHLICLFMIKRLSLSQMKRIVVFIIMMCILGQSIGALWALASFYKNQDYIVANQCVLRYEKVNTCKGVCILVKQITNLQDQQKEKPNLKLQDIIPLAVATEQNTLLPYTTDFNETVSKCYGISPDDLYRSSYSTSIYHPPIV